MNRLDAHIPVLANASPALRADFDRYAQVHHIPAGAPIAWEGDACDQLAIVLAGTVRVYKVGESGREITLYRIEETESCVLTASCILSRTQFPALAVAETDVEAVLIPAYVLRDWVARYEPWRDYVFDMMSQRLADVIATVEEVAFRRMDARIAEFLAGLGENGATIPITHQEIASELGTAREVVSRILKDLERGGLIALSRGAVTLLDGDGLNARAVMA
ncbi:MAG: Crp/Fnr family transcriptional regulator [Caldilineaceae bacterium]|nr:Crp/Fnr family transcriptional regulator [Caldilineaceae bacterium]